MVDENLQTVPKCTPINTKQVSPTPQSNHRMSKITVGFNKIFSAIAKMPVHKMAEIEKEEVVCPV